MSADNNTETEAADMMHCASCGKAEIDDIKLKDCDKKCDLARYCGDECQQDHLEKHEVICRERVAELRDEILFRQPESSHFGDCPICFLPLPLDTKKSGIHTCCGKEICKGCQYANVAHQAEKRLKQTCPFCRKQAAESDEEINTRLMNRAEANDPAALREIGILHANKGDYESAFEYYTRAAKLGDVIAHYKLSFLYHKGEGVENNEERAVYHMEEAAIAGHTEARYGLGLFEEADERYDRAVKHWIIAGNLGHDNAIQALKVCYKDGCPWVSEDDLAAALRAHQAAVDATKSPHREVAVKIDAEFAKHRT